jgi:hypothetical protein
MNLRPAILFLALIITLPEASVAADVNLHAARKVAEPYQTSPGPVGTCTIYIQGRYSACEFTSPRAEGCLRSGTGRPGSPRGVGSRFPNMDGAGISLPAPERCRSRPCNECGAPALVAGQDQAWLYR